MAPSPAGGPGPAMSPITAPSGSGSPEALPTLGTHMGSRRHLSQLPVLKGQQAPSPAPMEGPGHL